MRRVARFKLKPLISETDSRRFSKMCRVKPSDAQALSGCHALMRSVAMWCQRTFFAEQVIRQIWITSHFGVISKRMADESIGLINGIINRAISWWHPRELLLYLLLFASFAPSPTDQIRRSALPLSPAGNSI